jgi:hypothetical protein
MSAIRFSEYKSVAVGETIQLNTPLGNEYDTIVIPYVVGGGGTLDIQLSADAVNPVDIPALQGVAPTAMTPIAIPNAGCWQWVKVTVKIAPITFQIVYRSDRD